MNKEINLSYICTILRSLSSILLVQDDRWHPDIQSIFGKDNLQLFNLNLQEQFSVGCYSRDFDKKLTDEMENTLKVKIFTHKKSSGYRWLLYRIWSEKKISRLNAQIDLLQLARSFEFLDSKVIRSVAGLYVLI